MTGITAAFRLAAPSTGRSGNYVRYEKEPAPAADVKGPWYSFEYTFAMEQGEAKLPRAPISGKAVKEVPSPAMAE